MLLDPLPDEARVLQEIQYQMYVLDEISRGTDELERGEGLEHDEVKRRLEKWLKE